MTQTERRITCYIGQWSGMSFDETKCTPEEAIGSASSADRIKFTDSVYVIEDSIGIVEAIALRRKKSQLVKLLEEYGENHLLLGLEKSTSFTGKHKLFVVTYLRQDEQPTFCLEDLPGFKAYSQPEYRKKYPFVSVSAEIDGNIVAAFTFSATVNPPC